MAGQESDYDSEVLKSRSKYDLSENATKDEVWRKTAEMLNDPRQALDAAQILLGRRVDAREDMITGILFTPGLSPQERQALLLMEASVEESMTRNGISDFGTRRTAE